MLILGSPPQQADADFTMRIFNLDGGQVEMCGNGIRCLAKYLVDFGVVKKENRKKPIRIYTLGGIITAEVIEHPNGSHLITYVTVDMGVPKILNKDLNVEIQTENGMQIFNGISMLMPNPHFVIKLPLSLPISDDLVHHMGPLIETNPLFPNRTNVEFVHVKDDGSLQMRVWERGTGETKSCGTGVCAVAVAAMINGWIFTKRVVVHTLGGDLEIFWNNTNNHIYKTGPVTMH